jgi:hypothetical protein
MLEALAFGLPCREAVDVEVPLIHAWIVAVSSELGLELDLIVLQDLTTDRALHADAWPAPRTFRPAGG